MNLTYARLDLLRIVRSPSTFFFTAVLPLFFYLIFGGAQTYGDTSIGNGNVKLAIMVTMAAYGAVTAAATVGAGTAGESAAGWGRQLGLTALSDASYLLTKTLVTLGVVLVPVGLIYAAGWLTGAKGTASAWLGSAALIIAGSIVFALFGLVCGVALPPRAADAAASGSVVVMAFLGNMFFPLSGLMLTIAKFTPLYGLVSLARRPIAKGWWQVGTTGELVYEPLWIATVNLIAWTLIFATLCLVFVRRSRGSQ